MDCSLAALIACFSLGGLYIDTGMSYQDAGVYTVYHSDSASTVVSDGLIETNSSSQEFRTNSASNPYGRLSLGYQIDFSSVTWRLEVSHVSSLATDKDRGVNSIKIGARWFPFR